jgi:hypothetical protein
MKKIYFLFTTFTLINVSFSQITHIWDGGGTTNDFGDPYNWDTDLVPDDGDFVIFNNTSSKNCDFDGSVTALGGFTMSSYTGSFNQNSFPLIVMGNFLMTSGNYIMSSSHELIILNQLASTSNSLTINGGTFTTLNSNLTLAGVGNTTLVINGSAVNSQTFGTIKLTFDAFLDNNQRNFNFISPVTTQSLVISGNKLISLKGTYIVQNLLNLENTNTGNPSGSTGTIIIQGGTSNFTVTGSSIAGRCKLPNLLINKNTGYTLSGNISFLNAVVQNSISANPVASSSLSTLHFYGNCSVVTHTAAPTTASRRLKIGNAVIASGATLTLGNRHFLHCSGSFTNNGTINTTTSSILGMNSAGSQTITGNSFTVGSLWIGGTATRTVALTNTLNLTILDSVKINNVNCKLNTNNRLILESTNNLKAQITQIGNGSGSAINGNIIVKTFAPGGTTGWTNLGISGVNGNNLSNWDGQIPMTCNGCINGTTSAGGPFISVYRYHEPGSGGSEYVPMSASDPLTPGQGYWVYLGNGPSTTSDITWTVSGSAVQGSFDVNLTNTSGSAYPGFNLIANPYPSPVRFRELMSVNNGITTNSTNITNVIYIYNPDLGLTTSYNGVTNISSHSSGAKDVIPMGQGFHVEANTNTIFRFAEVAKNPNNTSSFSLLKTSAPNNTDTVYVDSLPEQKASYIRLSLTSNHGAWDETVIHFHPNASNQEDLLDAKKIFPNSFNTSTVAPDPKKSTISSISLNNYFSINSLPVSTNGYTIPVLAKTPVSGVFSISATELVDIPQGVCINLRDKYTNTIHNLLNGPYVFNLHDSTQAARFELIVCGGWLPTGVSDPLPKDPASFVQIFKGDNGLYLSGTYLNGSHIRITNLLGQVLYENKNVNAPDNKFELPFQSDEKLIIVTVQTQNEKVSRKFIN